MKVEKEQKAITQGHSHADHFGKVLSGCFLFIVSNSVTLSAMVL